MVDLLRVNASKELTKAEVQEESKRWQKMQKDTEKRRFEESLFSNKLKKTKLDNFQKQKTSRDADMYRFTQNKEYNKLKQMSQSKDLKNTNQKQLNNQGNTQENIKNIRERNESTNKLQQDINQKNQNNNNLNKFSKNTKNAQKQQLTANQESTKNASTTNSRDNILENNKQQQQQQQQRFQQDNQSNLVNKNIISNKQFKTLQDKKNQLLQSKATIINKHNLDDKLNKQSQLKNHSNILTSKETNKIISANKMQSKSATHQTQQSQQSQKLNDSLSDFMRNAQNKNLKFTANTEKNNKSDSDFYATATTIDKIDKQNKSRTLNDRFKQENIADINKNQLDSKIVGKNKQSFDSTVTRQQHDDLNNKQNIDKTNKNYLSQTQAEKQQTTIQENRYNLSRSQHKQEKNEKISIEKLYQENKILPLPQNIDPSSTISKAMQDPAQRVEIINHIVELIKTYRPFILKEGAFNIIMPGAFWEGTKIVVDIYKKDLEVKISASDQALNILQQNKSPLVEALKMADPKLNIKVDIKPVT